MRVEAGKFRISECGKSAASYAADHIPISARILPAASAPERTQSGTPMPL
jgi:hypothetical protein